jgi:hypothetical protein
MPCPYFEPDAPIATPAFHNSRLPLIEEYSGRCIRTSTSRRASDYAACNQGYARAICENFPNQQTNGAWRYSFVRRDQDQLEILWIGEEEHFPVLSRPLHFSIAADCLVEKEVDCCVQAQVTAFCRSYLRKICSQKDTTVEKTAERAL